MLWCADSPTASVATSARVFNPYATHTAAPEAQTPTDDAISSLEPSSAPFESSATPPDASSTPLEPSTAEASSTLAQDSQSSVAAYPSSPFANHVPAPSSSAALSAASEGEEAAVVAQQDSSEVVDSAPAVEQVRADLTVQFVYNVAQKASSNESDLTCCRPPSPFSVTCWAVLCQNVLHCAVFCSAACGKDWHNSLLCFEAATKESDLT